MKISFKTKKECKKKLNVKNAKNLWDSVEKVHRQWNFNVSTTYAYHVSIKPVIGCPSSSRSRFTNSSAFTINAIKVKKYPWMRSIFSLKASDSQYSHRYRLKDKLYRLFALSTKKSKLSFGAINARSFYARCACLSTKVMETRLIFLQMKKLYRNQTGWLILQTLLFSRWIQISPFFMIFHLKKMNTTLFRFLRPCSRLPSY